MLWTAPKLCVCMLDFPCMGLLPDTQKCGLRMRRERFPHVPWCLPRSLTHGFLWRRWRPGKHSQHSWRMRNRNFTYLVRGPWSRRSNECVAKPRSQVVAKWHGNSFCITGPSFGNPPVTGGFPSQRVNNTEVRSFLWWTNQTVELLMILDGVKLVGRYFNIGIIFLWPKHGNTSHK